MTQTKCDQWGTCTILREAWRERDEANRRREAAVVMEFQADDERRAALDLVERAQKSAILVMSERDAAIAANGRMAQAAIAMREVLNEVLGSTVCVPVGPASGATFAMHLLRKVMEADLFARATALAAGPKEGTTGNPREEDGRERCKRCLAAERKAGEGR